MLGGLSCTPTRVLTHTVSIPHGKCLLVCIKKVCGSQIERAILKPHHMGNRFEMIVLLKRYEAPEILV